MENIRGVKWSKGDFEQLILDVSVKEVLSALLRQQLGTRREAKATVDNSRGMGLIVLLHGGPGTGKTRTAEAVAELLEAPLYRITSGDIGLAAEEVDRNLELVFRLANAWNAGRSAWTPCRHMYFADGYLLTSCCAPSGPVR